MINIKNIGKKFSGDYFIKRSTHSITSAGYTTNFQIHSEEEGTSENEDCVDELEPVGRNGYFYGKLLTVTDFEDEQKYIKDKQSHMKRLSMAYKREASLIAILMDLMKRLGWICGENVNISVTPKKTVTIKKESPSENKMKNLIFLKKKKRKV